VVDKVVGIRDIWKEEWVVQEVVQDNALEQHQMVVLVQMGKVMMAHKDMAQAHTLSEQVEVEVVAQVQLLLIELV
jgi:hypothetical protein